MNQKQKMRGVVTAHTLKNSRAEKECHPQAHDFRAIFLPSKLALGNRCADPEHKRQKNNNKGRKREAKTRKI